jgi:hypothetical protein
MKMDIKETECVCMLREEHRLRVFENRVLRACSTNGGEEECI